jgi:ubiquitin thioesterase OTU1
VTAATRKVIPNDNSCLFHAVAFSLGVQDSPETMRSIVVRKILSNPGEWEGMLDRKTVSEYTRWIMLPESWGGQVEMQILSSHYKCEIVSIDIKVSLLLLFLSRPYLLVTPLPTRTHTVREV